MNWKKWFKLLSFFLLVALVFFGLRSDFWAVEKISCRLDDQDCPADLWRKTTELSLGKNLIFFSQKSFEKNIQNNFPGIGQIKIKKGIFKDLSFSFSSQKAVAALAIELPLNKEATPSGQQEFLLSGNFYWLGQDGTVLEKTDKADGLPLILIEKDPNLNVGQSFEQQGSAVMIPLLMGLKLHVIDFKVIRIVSSREIEVWLQGQTLVLFNGEKDLENQLDSLQLILSRSKIEGKSIKKIDLRFDKPVIN
jgi:hypothetical protein